MTDTKKEIELGWCEVAVDGYKEMIAQVSDSAIGAGQLLKLEVAREGHGGTPEVLYVPAARVLRIRPLRNDEVSVLVTDGRDATLRLVASRGKPFVNQGA